MQKTTTKTDTSVNNIASIIQDKLHSVYGVISLVDVKKLTKASKIPNGYTDGVIVKKVGTNISVSLHVILTDIALKDDISYEIEKQVRYIIKQKLKIDIKNVEVIVYDKQ